MMKIKEEVHERSAAIDAVRALSCYAIVFHHMVFPGIKFCGCYFEEACVSTVRNLCWSLPTLFLISGYLMMKGYTSKTVASKFVHRVKRLVLPFVVYNVLYVIVFNDINTLCSLPTWVAIFGFAKNCPCFPFWYIRVLMIFFIVSPLLYLMTFNTKGQLVLIGTSFVWCVLSTLLQFDIDLCMTLPSYAILLFCIGATLARRKIDLCDLAIRYRTLFIVLGMIGMTFVVLHFHNGIALALPAFFPMALSDKILILFRGRFCRLLVDSAFYAYGVHLILRALFLILPIYPKQFVGAYAISTGLGFLFVICSILMSFIVLRKLGGPVHRVLSGSL